MAPVNKINLEIVRKSLKLLNQYLYLNTGAVGPLSEETVATIRQEQDYELINGRAGVDIYLRKRAIKNEVRAALSKLINALPEELALTQNTTEGINIVVNGRNWHEGDEVVTTDVEHGAILLPLFQIAKRYGVVVKKAKVGTDPVQAIEEQITSRTKLIALSHVSYSTGAVLPLNDIIHLAHGKGIPVLVDGAQSVGTIPVDVKALDVDYYSLPGHKWLLGPEGTGALFTRQDRLEELFQPFIGYGSVAQFSQDETYILRHGAERFEISTMNLPKLAGQKASINWLTEKIGWSEIFERTGQLAEKVKSQLAAIKGVTVLTPEKAAGLVSFRVLGVEPPTIVETLAGKRIIIRGIKELAAARASIAFYNTEKELEDFVQSVAALQNNRNRS